MPQDMRQFGFRVEIVEPDEIVDQSKGRWAALFDNVVAAYESQLGRGVFVAPFERRDTQNFNNATRKKAASMGFRLRQRLAKRGDVEGVYLWIETVQ